MFVRSNIIGSPSIISLALSLSAVIVFSPSEPAVNVSPMLPVISFSSRALGGKVAEIGRIPYVQSVARSVFYVFG